MVVTIVARPNSNTVSRAVRQPIVNAGTSLANEPSVVISRISGVSDLFMEDWIYGGNNIFTLIRSQLPETQKTTLNSNEPFSRLLSDQRVVFRQLVDLRLVRPVVE